MDDSGKVFTDEDIQRIKHAAQLLKEIPGDIQIAETCGINCTPMRELLQILNDRISGFCEAAKIPRPE